MHGNSGDQQTNKECAAGEHIAIFSSDSCTSYHDVSSMADCGRGIAGPKIIYRLNSRNLPVRGSADLSKVCFPARIFSSFDGGPKYRGGDQWVCLSMRELRIHPCP